MTFLPLCLQEQGLDTKGELISRLACYLRYLAFWSHLPHHRERQPVSHGIETAQLLTEQLGKHRDHLEEKGVLVRYGLLAETCLWPSFPDQLVKDRLNNAQKEKMR